MIFTTIMSFSQLGHGRVVPPFFFEDIFAGRRFVVAIGCLDRPIEAFGC